MLTNPRDSRLPFSDQCLPSDKEVVLNALSSGLIVLVTLDRYSDIMDTELGIAEVYACFARTSDAYKVYQDFAINYPDAAIIFPSRNDNDDLDPRIILRPIPSREEFARLAHR